MKISQSHYSRLSMVIMGSIDSIPTYDEYKEQGLSDKRYRWDLLWAASKNTEGFSDFINKELYSYLDDTHIDTALKKITRTS